MLDQSLFDAFLEARGKESYLPIGLDRGFFPLNAKVPRYMRWPDIARLHTAEYVQDMLAVTEVVILSALTKLIEGSALQVRAYQLLYSPRSGRSALHFQHLLDCLGAVVTKVNIPAVVR
ncbi:hypothetical protein G5B41_17480 [bacterium SGD-2]|nr:hypothetical protein [bacterium SGD-2]